MAVLNCPPGTFLRGRLALPASLVLDAPHEHLAPPPPTMHRCIPSRQLLCHVAFGGARSRRAHAQWPAPPHLFSSVAAAASGRAWERQFRLCVRVDKMAKIAKTHEGKRPPASPTPSPPWSVASRGFCHPLGFPGWRPSPRSPSSSSRRRGRRRPRPT